MMNKSSSEAMAGASFRRVAKETENFHPTIRSRIYTTVPGMWYGSPAVKTMAMANKPLYLAHD